MIKKRITFRTGVFYIVLSHASCLAAIRFLTMNSVFKCLLAKNIFIDFLLPENKIFFAALQSVTEHIQSNYLWEVIFYST